MASPRTCGLSREEAKARLAEFGPNLLVERERAAHLVQWLWMLADPMALMLAGSRAALFVAWQAA